MVDGGRDELWGVCQREEISVVVRQRSFKSGGQWGGRRGFELGNGLKKVVSVWGDKEVLESQARDVMVGGGRQGGVTLRLAMVRGGDGEG